MPSDAQRCPRCKTPVHRTRREADHLDRIADQVKDRPAAVVHIIDSCLRIGVDLVELLPGIIAGILGEGSMVFDVPTCTCGKMLGGELCPVCATVRDLDNISREMLAA
jgi:hypothetical protein